MTVTGCSATHSQGCENRRARSVRCTSCAAMANEASTVGPSGIDAVPCASITGSQIQGSRMPKASSTVNTTSTTGEPRPS